MHALSPTVRHCTGLQFIFFQSFFLKIRETAIWHKWAKCAILKCSFQCFTKHFSGLSKSKLALQYMNISSPSTTEPPPTPTPFRSRFLDSSLRGRFPGSCYCVLAHRNTFLPWHPLPLRLLRYHRHRYSFPTNCSSGRLIDSQNEDFYFTGYRRNIWFSVILRCAISNKEHGFVVVNIITIFK